MGTFEHWVNLLVYPAVVIGLGVWVGLPLRRLFAQMAAAKLLDMRRRHETAQPRIDAEIAELARQKAESELATQIAAGSVQSYLDAAAAAAPEHLARMRQRADHIALIRTMLEMWRQRNRHRLFRPTFDGFLLTLSTRGLMDSEDLALRGEGRD